MKKKVKIVLGIVLVLAVAFAGFIIYRLITGPAEDLSLTEEQRKEMLTGEWIDPRGAAEPYVFHEDGTGHILGKDITWKLSGGHDEGRGAAHACFYVDYYFSGSQNADGTLYFDYYDEWDLVLSVCDSSEGIGEYNVTWYRCKEGTVDVVRLTADNWDTYFEIAGADKWVEVNGEKYWNGYVSSLYLKPEYTNLFTSMGHTTVGNRIQYKISAQCSVVPYYEMVDEANRTSEILGRNEEEEIRYTQYNMTFEIPDVPLKRLWREDGAAAVTEITNEHQWVADEKGLEKYSIQMIEDINVVDASGLLFFAKEYDPEKDARNAEE